jgi:hypothetical protein
MATTATARAPHKRLGWTPGDIAGLLEQGRMAILEARECRATARVAVQWAHETSRRVVRGRRGSAQWHAARRDSREP